LNFENEHLKEGTPWVPLERVNLVPQSRGWTRARQVMQQMRLKSDAPILRLAGGELMALPGAIDFLEEIAPDWDRVQVLTNATFLRKDIHRLAKIPSLNLCCSVDGHTPELNALRTPKVDWARRIIDGMLSAVEAGVPVEVYTVLTKHNTDALYDFACYLAELDRKADLRLLPFPVRGEIASELWPAQDQFASVARLLENYASFADILPPPEFLKRLLDFGLSRRRTARCRVPLSFMQTFDDGVVASCSNCWASPLGNLLKDENVLHQVGKANIHKLFLRNPPRFPFCKGCFTPFDVVNVYLDGGCSLEEISAMDLYSSPAVRDRLATMRDAWGGGSATAIWASDPETLEVAPQTGV
jgi:MoaA/NifB/PqqE/SkfB family radical SAM enzyme